MYPGKNEIKDTKNQHEIKKDDKKRKEGKKAHGQRFKIMNKSV